MTPGANKAWGEGRSPLLNDEITEEQAIGRIVGPFRAFMAANTRERDLALFSGLAESRSSSEGDSAVGGVLDTILKGRQDVTEGANAATSADGAFVKADIAESIDLRALIPAFRSEEHTSELQSLMRNSYAVFCLKKKQKT